MCYQYIFKTHTKMPRNDDLDLTLTVQSSSKSMRPIKFWVIFIAGVSTDKAGYQQSGSYNVLKISMQIPN